MLTHDKGELPHDLVGLCAEARDLVDAILHRLHGRKRRLDCEDEPTLEEALADMWTADDGDDPLVEHLLRPLYASGRSPCAGDLSWEAFEFRCKHDLVFALHAMDCL